MSLLYHNKLHLKNCVKTMNNILIFGNTSILDYLDLSKKNVDIINESNGYIKFGESYMNKMFYTKKFDKEQLQQSRHSLGLIAYDVPEKILKNNYDMVLLFGPDNNGRDIMMLQIMNRLKPGAYIMVNKEEKYNVENLKKLFKLKEVFHNFIPEGRIYLYKII